MYLSWKTPACLASTDIVANAFATHRGVYGRKVPLIATSGAFDPLHVGHIRCIQASAMLKGDNGLFVVIVNGDGFLKRKKGYVFMPLEERLEILSSIRGIDFIFPWDDGSQHVTKALELIKPNIFVKGGNKQIKDVPEYDMCNKINCNVVFGIGGEKQVQSSSELVNKFQLPKGIHGNNCSDTCCD
jgi:cytidyltransferase-like protein